MSQGTRVRTDAATATPSLLMVLGCVFVGTNIALVRLAGIEAPPHDVQRILQIVLFAAIAVGVWLPSLRRGIYETWSRLPRTARGGVAAFLAIGTLSSTLAAFPSAGVREVATFTALIVVALAVAWERRRSGGAFDRRALAVLSATALVYVVTFLVIDPFTDRGPGMFGFSHPRFFGQVGLWILPLAVAGGLVLRERLPVRVILWTAATVWCALVFESASRAAIFGTLVGIASVAVLLRRRAQGWILAMGGVFAGGLALWFLLFRVFSTPSSDFVGLGRVVAEIGDDKARIFLWGDAIRLLRSRPLLGVGPEHYALYTEQAFAAHPHSAPMQLLAEWGLPATAIAAVLVSWGLVSWFRAQRHARSQHGDPALVAGLSGAIVAGTFAAMVDGIIVMPVSQVLFAAVTGWMLGIHLPPVTEPATMARRSYAVPVASTVAVAVLAITATPYGLRPAQEVDQYIAEHPDGYVAPRYWQIGWLGR